MTLSIVNVLLTDVAQVMGFKEIELSFIFIRLILNPRTLNAICTFMSTCIKKSPKM